MSVRTPVLPGPTSVLPGPTSRLGPAPRLVRPGPGAAADRLADTALDEALAHISDLAERLWAVRRLHPPVRSRSLLGGVRLRCGGCGHRSPCPTLQAVAPPPVRAGQ